MKRTLSLIMVLALLAASAVLPALAEGADGSVDQILSATQQSGQPGTGGHPEVFQMRCAILLLPVVYEGRISLRHGGPVPRCERRVGKNPEPADAWAGRHRRPTAGCEIVASAEKTSFGTLRPWKAP